MNMSIRSMDTARLVVLLALLGGTASAQAVDVTFGGTLVAPPPCAINANQPITVDFGNEMLAGRVDGSAYEEPITYSMDCTTALPITNALKMMFEGNTAGFDPTVLVTSKAEVGLELRRDGVKQSINTWFNFDATGSHPVLTAVPVKAPASTVSGGTFTATATLTVDYQ